MRLLSVVLVCVAVAAALADESNARFLAWLAENGASHAAVAVKDFDQYGKGLLAMQSIKHGDMLMDIPAKIIVSRETLSSAGQRLPYVTPELLRDVQNDEDVIAIVLAREKLRGENTALCWLLCVLRMCVYIQLLLCESRRRIALEALFGRASVVRPAAGAILAPRAGGASAPSDAI